MPVVTNRTLANEIFTSPARRLVDFVGIGDSNQIYGGFGNDHGWQFALAARYAMHATGIISASENLENGSGAGYGYGYERAAASKAQSVPQGAPAGIQDYWNAGDTTPDVHGPHYYSDYTIVASGQFQNGIAIQAAVPGGSNRGWKFYVSCINGTNFGTFQPVLRNTQSGGINLWGSVISTNGTPGYTIHSHTVAASFTTNPSANLTLSMSNDFSGGAVMTLGAGGHCVPVFNRAAPQSGVNGAGFAYTTQGYMGGRHLKNQYDALVQWNAGTWNHWFEMLRAPQLDATVSMAPRVVWIIQSGLNDVNGTATLSTDGVNMTSTKAGYKANLKSIIDLIRDTYDASYDPADAAERFFVLARSHRVADNSGQAEWAQEQSMVQYAEAIEEICADPAYSAYCCAFDPSLLHTRAEAASVPWYASSGTDENHFIQAGSEAIFTRVLGELVSNGGDGRFNRFSRNGRFNRFS